MDRWTQGSNNIAIDKNCCYSGFCYFHTKENKDVRRISAVRNKKIICTSVYQLEQSKILQY